MFKKIIISLAALGFCQLSLAYNASPGVKVVRIKSVCKGFKSCGLVENSVSKKKALTPMYAGIQTFLDEFWGKTNYATKIWSTYHAYITNTTDSDQRYTINLSLTENESTHQETLQIDMPPNGFYENELSVLSEAQEFSEGDYAIYATGSISGVQNSDDSARNYFRVRN